MTDAEGMLIADAKALLHREVTAQLSVDQSSDLLRAFCAYAVPSFGSMDVSDLSRRVAAHAGAERAYRDVAVLGFINARRALPTDEADALSGLLDWVSQCSIEVDGTPVGISTDAVAVLGIAIAAASANPDLRMRVSAWLDKATTAAPALEPWKRSVMAISRFIARAEAPNYDDITEVACEVALICSAKGFGNLGEQARDECEIAVLERVRSLTFSSDDIKAAFLLGALELILSVPRTVRPEHATVDDVARILSGLEGSFRRWTWEDSPKTQRAPARQWNVDHEYHLQNILWFLLYPIFPNLRDEEYLTSTGQLQPRSDLCIPHLGLVIEAKFMYPKTTARQMIEEISADASLYLKAGSGFTTLIPVIWDERSRTEEHPILKRGLNEIRGVTDSVIVSRPAKMTAMQPTAANGPRAAGRRRAGG